MTIRHRHSRACLTGAHRSAWLLPLLSAWWLSTAVAAPVGLPPAKDHTVQAAAATPPDAITRLLADRGLLPEPAQQMVRQMRDATSDLVMTALNFIGVPYRRGGNEESTGFDCSGFTRHVFESTLGLVLPRRSRDQAQAEQLQPVSKDELKPGDLVFFNTMRHAFSHVGIYIGDGKFVHAPRAGKDVRVDQMADSYWSRRFNGARRADPAEPVPASTQRR
ncbi:MAG: C40 family peptidase [Aquabacterium sp.]